MEIEHENLTIKQANGYWRCPFACHDKRFPKPKWKTEKPFRNHLNICKMMPSKVAAKAKAENAKVELATAYLDALNKLKVDFIASLPYKVGDTVYFVHEIIVKPTHEQRGRRLVKVRYEAVKRYQCANTEIKSFDFGTPSKLPDFEYLKKLLLINNDIPYSRVTSKELATNEAAIKTQGNSDYRKQSSLYR